MVEWRIHKEVNQSVPTLGMFSDCLRHCVQWQYYSDNLRSGIPTGAHECTHGIHSDLRNGATALKGGDSTAKYSRLIFPPLAVDENNVRHFASKPIEVFGRSNVNAIYVGKDRYQILDEPKIRKRDAAAVVPRDLRGPRYSLYLSGQTAWDDSPLYVWDEWVAYRNGAQAAIDAYDAGEYKERSDQPIGPLEFQVYAICVLIAADKAGVDFDYLLPAAKWHWKACWNTYHEAQKRFEWSTPLFNNFKSGSSAGPIREWLKAHGFESIPDNVIDGWPDEDLSPSTDAFLTV